MRGKAPAWEASPPGADPSVRFNGCADGPDP